MFFPPNIGGKEIDEEQKKGTGRGMLNSKESSEEKKERTARKEKQSSNEKGVKKGEHEGRKNCEKKNSRRQGGIRERPTSFSKKRELERLKVERASLDNKSEEGSNHHTDLGGG